MNFWAEANQIQKFLRGRSNIIQTTMGIDGLLKELHGGRMTEQSVGFAELTKWLHKSKTPIDIDTGTLLVVLRRRQRCVRLRTCKLSCRNVYHSLKPQLSCFNVIGIATKSSTTPRHAKAATPPTIMMLWSCSLFDGPGLALGPRLFTNDPSLTKNHNNKQ
jgi:hypothetical protein